MSGRQAQAWLSPETDPGTSPIRPRLVASELYKTHCGLRLRASREALGLTARQYADEIGIAPTALYNWEAGLRLPDILAMIRGMQRFGITIDWIYVGDLGGIAHRLAVEVKARAEEYGAHIGAPLPDWIPPAPATSTRR